MLTITLTSFAGCKEKKVESNNKTTKENEVVEEKKEVNYKALYKEEVDKLISEFGKYDNPGNGLPIKGVKYGELLDFDKDNIPEMIILHDMKVLLYKVRDNKVQCIAEGSVGSKYAQSDINYTFGINVNENGTSIVIPNSKSEWTEELISIVTVENNNSVIKKLTAKTAPDNGIPIRDSLISYYIDDQEVSKDEYYKIYDSQVKNCKNINAMIDESPGNASELETFIQSLQ